MQYGLFHAYFANILFSVETRSYKRNYKIYFTCEASKTNLSNHYLLWIQHSACQIVLNLAYYVHAGMNNTLASYRLVTSIRPNPRYMASQILEVNVLRSIMCQDTARFDRGDAVGMHGIGIGINIR